MLKYYKRPRFWRQERLFTVHDGKLVQCDLQTVCCCGGSMTYEVGASAIVETAARQHVLWT